jgi:hypothetical protein
VVLDVLGELDQREAWRDNSGPGAYGEQSVTLNCGETSDPLTFDADVEYTVSETPPDGYAEPSIRGLCDGDGTFTLEPGETGTCVVRNTRLATASIMKECATTDEATDFVIDLTGPGTYGEQSVVLNCGETSDPLTVEAGVEYTVSENTA